MSLRRCRGIPIHKHWVYTCASIVLALGFAACTAPHTQSPAASAPASGPSTYILDQIEPVPRLPEPGVVAAELPVDAARQLRTARERFDSELWSEAIAAARKAIQIAPRCEDAHLLVARAALQQGNVALARTHLDSAAQH